MNTRSLFHVFGKWAGCACIAATCFVAVCHSPAAAQSVTVTADQTIANKFVRHTVTGITTPLPVLPAVTGLIGASYLTIEDLDGDGIKEIICTSGVGPDSDLYTADGQVVLFTWNGINKDAWTQTVLNSTFAFPNETYVRDMDGDTDLDIVVCDQFLASANGGIYYLENKGGDITAPSNWVKQVVHLDTTSTSRSYHRIAFLDVDGDGDEDIVTMNLSGWTGWLENTGTLPYTPRTIGTGGGSLFAMFDIDGDGDLDIVTAQFNITNSLFDCLVLTGIAGDALLWFENPGPVALAANKDLAWNRYTINNYYTSPTPVGKGFEVVIEDINNDGTSELVVSNHNHQNKDSALRRIWPSGIYYFNIPGLNGNSGDPTVAADWEPIKIETGNPDFVYASGAARRSDPYNDANVPLDVYAVDRKGTYYDQGAPGMVRAGDVNSDGLVDLVVPGDGKGRLYYYEAGDPSGGSLTFKRASLYTDLQCMPADAKIVDLDGDGDLDIVAGIFDTSVSKAYPYTSASVFFFEQQDQPPVFLSEPLWYGAWVGLSSDPANPHKPTSENILVWVYDDDRLTCPGGVELSWKYRPVELQEGVVVALGDWVVKEPWRYLWYAWIETPGIADITGPGLFEFKMTATDCLDQTIDSEVFWGKRYYFQVD